MMFRFGNAIAIGAFVAALAAQSASAEQIRIAVGLTGDNPLVNGMHRFAEQLEAETRGKWTGRIFEMSLLNLAESMTGVRDGVAEVTYVVPAYHRAEFGLTNLIVDMATATTDPVVMSAAASEYVFNCPECLAEYAAEGQVFMGLSAIGPYYLQSNEPLTEPGDFTGKTIRGFGPFGRWVEAMGASPVVMSANDVYEAFSQGQIDGNTHTPETLQSQSWGEVVDYLLLEPIGIYAGNANFNTNRELWNKLPVEERRAFLNAAAYGHAWTTVTYDGVNRGFLADLASVGAKGVEASEEIARRSEAFRAGDGDAVARINTDQHGIGDASERVARFRELVAKWEGLIAGIDRSDVNAVVELYRKEIFDPIDPAAL